jgi:hypothetical protein
MSFKGALKHFRSLVVTIVLFVREPSVLCRLTLCFARYIYNFIRGTLTVASFHNVSQAWICGVHCGLHFDKSLHYYCSTQVGGCE